MNFLILLIKKALRPFVPERFRHLGHFVVAEASSLVYGLPSRGLIVVGITGTNGKSTVVSILHHILSSCGLKIASISSLKVNIDGKEVLRGTAGSAKNTMPGWFDLQKFFSAAKRAGCQVAIVEVTSEGIKQHRHRGIFFDRAVFTNLKPEHIEAHGSFESYRDAKGKLFSALSRWKNGVRTASIVNLDDPSAYYYLNFDADEKWGYGTDEKNGKSSVKTIVADEIKCTKTGISFKIEGTKFESSLIGEFNVSNLLCAITSALSFYLPLEDIRKAVKSAEKVPGRLEVLAEKPVVIVDYAHTPDALEKVYTNSKNLWLSDGGKIIAVLGAAGGGRDRWKRVEFGKIADRYADEIILTNEDPYLEDPEAIVADISHGIKSKNVEIIIDRREAINSALSRAQDNDVVIITGKGAEQSMQTAAGPLYWDDRAVVEELLKEKE